MSDVPRLGRVSFHGAATEAAPDKPDDDSYKGRVARQASGIVPLQKIQEVFDQLTPLADRYARGGPWDHSGGTFKTILTDTLSHALYHRDVLRTAAAAADAMIEDMNDHVEGFMGAVDSARPKAEPPMVYGGGLDVDPSAMEEDCAPAPGFACPIKTQAEHDAVVAEIDRLITKGDLTDTEGQCLNTLGDAVKAWQDARPS
jgi:hypothetical protein